ncbi:MAG: RidA family protein [Thermoguttaceae bacterium]
MSAEQRLADKLAELGQSLPAAAEAKGLYRTVVFQGNLAYTSGHLPVTADGTLLKGKLGADCDVEAGCKAAELTALGILATMKAALGSLDRVRRVVKLFGMVNCTGQFDQQPAVINGASRLLAEVFGPDAGIGARSAMGAGSLPLGVPVEIEAVFEVER